MVAYLVSKKILGQIKMIDSNVRSTLDHIKQVQSNLNHFASELVERGIKHDASKLHEPEVSAFARANNLLAKHEYGSTGYQKAIQSLGPALRHHYENNSHHPEHFANGIDGMTLFDLIEMYCDWQAAVLRQKNGDLLKSIDVNEIRFNLSPQLAQILRNTVTVNEPATPATPPATPATPPATPPARRELIDVPDWVTINDVQAPPGTEYWRLKKVEYWDDQKSGGTHHIYTKSPHDPSAQIVVSNGHHEWKVPLDKPSNEPSSNFAMWGGNYYKAWMDGLPSDSIEGMHMPAKHHVSYLLWWEKTTA